MTTRQLVLAGAGLVGAATTATSAYSLYELAQACGIPGVLAAALPIALDVSAAVAALVWITEPDPLRRWGRAIAIAALVGSLAGNGVQHAIASGLLAVSLPLVLVVGAAIPASLWATVHLAAMTMTPSKPATHRAKRPASAHDAGRALAETPPRRTPREPLHAVAPVSTAAKAREWIAAQLDAGRTDLTGADVDTALGLVGKQRCGARELAKVLARREQVSA